MGLHHEEIRRAFKELRERRYVMQLSDRSYMITLKGMSFLLRKRKSEQDVLEVVWSPKQKKACKCIRSIYGRIRKAVMSREPGDLRIDMNLYASMDVMNFLCDYYLLPDDSTLLKHYVEFVLDVAESIPRLLNGFLSIPPEPTSYFEMVKELSEVFERRTYVALVPHPFTISAKVAHSLQTLARMPEECRKKINADWNRVRRAEEEIRAILSRPDMVSLCPLVTHLPFKKEMSLRESALRGMTIYRSTVSLPVYSPALLAFGIIDPELVEIALYGSIQEVEVEDLYHLIDLLEGTFIGSALLVRLFAELDRFLSWVRHVKNDSYREQQLMWWNEICRIRDPGITFEIFRKKHKLYRIYRMASRLTVLCSHWRTLRRAVSPGYLESVIKRTVFESFRELSEAVREILAGYKRSGFLNGLSVALMALQSGREIHPMPADLETELKELEGEVIRSIWDSYEDSIKIDDGEPLSGWAEEWSLPISTSVRVLRSMIRAREILPPPPD